MKPVMQSAPINILLADDNVDDIFLFRKALSEIHLQTHLTTVMDGEQLMHHLSVNCEVNPDILFLDIIMPRKSGLECLSEIKENAKLKYIPIVMFATPFTRGPVIDLDVKNVFDKKGADSYIHKTSDAAQLKLDIYKALVSLIKKRSINLPSD